MSRPHLGVALLLICLIPGHGYAQKDDVAAIQTALGDLFQIYVLKKEKRTAQDTVVVQQTSTGVIAEISYWRSLKSREPAEEICNAYRWLLFGRGSYGKGAPDAFTQFPTLKQINLRFFDVDFGTKVGKKKAEILPTQKVVPYLRIGVTKASLLRKKLNWPSVKAEMDTGKCADAGKKYLDLTWFDQAYLKQAQ